MVALCYFFFEHLSCQGDGNVGYLSLDILFGTATAESRILFGTAYDLIGFFFCIRHYHFTASGGGSLGVSDDLVCLVICSCESFFPFCAALVSFAFCFCRIVKLLVYARLTLCHSRLDGLEKKLLDDKKYDQQIA